MTAIALAGATEALAQRPRLQWRKPSATNSASRPERADAEPAPVEAPAEEGRAEEVWAEEIHDDAGESKDESVTKAQSVRMQLDVEGDEVHATRVQQVSHNESSRRSASAPPTATKIRPTVRRARLLQVEDDEPAPRRRGQAPRLAPADDETAEEEMPADDVAPADDVDLPAEVDEVPVVEEPTPADEPTPRPRPRPRRQPEPMPDEDSRAIPMDETPMDDSSSDEPDTDDADSSSTDTRPRTREEEECERLRKAALSGPIQNISIDISEPGKVEADISYRYWRNLDGKLIEARFLELDGDMVVLAPRGGGDNVKIPRSRLTAHERRRIMRLPPFCEVGGMSPGERCYSPLTYTWKASALCHKPLYFEQIQLERYGHDAGPIVQPVISGAHFFGAVLLLPYSMGIEPPQECVYPLGYYRPGDCAPYMIPPFPLSLRAAAYEAGAIAGGILIIP